jgi:2-polyprenyl-6-methoxyphenol hydroxylase-like FAD-dependent oxidoreductase
MEARDVLIVGGGIAGSSIGKALATAGHSVRILESTKVFIDRNRGEFIFPWGSVEAANLDVYDDLTDIGCELFKLQYAADAEPLDLVTFTKERLPALGFHHPDMQERLLNSASAAGASVYRSARAINIERRQDCVEVVARIDGREQLFTCDFLVVADGRNSAVRRKAGFTASKGRPGRMIAGVLVGNCGVPEDCMVATRNSELGCSTTVIPLGSGEARAYFCYETGSRDPMSGPDDFGRFSKDSYEADIPESYYAKATVKGPLASFDCTHVWVEHPYDDRIALIGDAAGCTDPTQGQGLSLSLRDARVLRDALLDDSDWDAAGHAYAVEHDRYFSVISTYIGWVRDLVLTSGSEADEMRAKALPKWEQDPTRNPMLNFRGPDIELTEEIRNRFFGND